LNDVNCFRNVSTSAVPSPPRRAIIVLAAREAINIAYMFDVIGRKRKETAGYWHKSKAYHEISPQIPK